MLEATLADRQLPPEVTQSIWPPTWPLNSLGSTPGMPFPDFPDPAFTYAVVIAPVQPFPSEGTKLPGSAVPNTYGDLSSNSHLPHVTLPSEPPRVCRRLQPLRGWSNEHDKAIWKRV